MSVTARVVYMALQNKQVGRPNWKRVWSDPTRLEEVEATQDDLHLFQMANRRWNKGVSKTNLVTLQSLPYTDQGSLTIIFAG